MVLVRDGQEEVVTTMEQEKRQLPIKNGRVSGQSITL